MTNEERKVFELALEALEYIRNFETDVASQTKYGQAAEAIKEALAQPDQDEVDIRSRLYQRIHELETQLAQPEQEPVKMVAYNCTCGRTMKFESVHGVVAPQRTWIGLTDDDEIPWDGVDAKSFAKAIEAKLRSKNNA